MGPMLSPGGRECGRRGRNTRRPRLPRSKSEVEGVSAQRGSRPPGTRAAGALRRRILAAAGAHRVPRAALRLPSGSRSGRQLSPRRSPGRPLCPRREPGGRGPSRRPQLQPVFVASSCSTARPRLVAPRFARSRGSLLLGGCTHLQRSGRLAGMHQPPQVAKSGGEKAPAPPPPAPSPGVGGGEAGEPRQPRRRQRAAEARMQPRGPRRLESLVRAEQGVRGDGPKDGAPGLRAREVQRGGARRALPRPWPGAARGGSRDLSLAPPGARRRLARFRPACRALRPRRRRPGSSPSPR